MAAVGEVEAAGRVEDDVVRGLERAAVALGVEGLGLAGREVDGFDPPGDRQRAGDADQESGRLVPVEAAVVGDVDPPVGAGRGAVRPAAALGDDLESARTRAYAEVKVLAARLGKAALTYRTDIAAF